MGDIGLGRPLSRRRTESVELSNPVIPLTCDDEFCMMHDVACSIMGESDYVDQHPF